MREAAKLLIHRAIKSLENVDWTCTIEDSCLKQDSNIGLVNAQTPFLMYNTGAALLLATGTSSSDHRS